MDYKKGYVYELMDQGGPTVVTESYFLEASEECLELEHFALRHRIISITY